jgi:hypothetical protein
MRSMPAPEQVAVAIVLVAVGGRAAFRVGRSTARRVALKRRLARLREDLPAAPSTNHAKMLVARALLPWPWATICLDGFAPGVDLPAEKRSSAMTLQLGEDMPVPIRGLICNQHGIGGTLSFDGKPARTWVPWEAVYAIGQSHERPEWGWTQAMEPESRARVSTALYQMSLRCPGCNRPPLGEAWLCETCGERFDPFVGAISSSCSHPTPQGVECAGCRQRFQLSEWRVGDR